MKVVTYPSVSDIPVIWQSYFKNKPPSVSNDYRLACLIEKSLYDFGIDQTAVLVFMDGETVYGIMPVSYEQSRGWSYYPSYMFISVTVTIDPVVWTYLPDLLPRPFRIYETSFKTVAPAWTDKSEANVINLSPYDCLNTYLNDLDKKIRSKFKNCLNRNLDVEVVMSQEYKTDNESVSVRQSYIDYCAERFLGSEDESYFKNQLSIFPDLFKTAEMLGQLITLEFRIEGKLVAINYSVMTEDCLYDYICYRMTDEDLEKRSLGIFAILKNIEYVLMNKTGDVYYDLASEFLYKKQFLPEIKFHQVTVSLGMANG